MDGGGGALAWTMNGKALAVKMFGACVNTAWKAFKIAYSGQELFSHSTDTRVVNVQKFLVLPPPFLPNVKPGQ